MKHAVTTLAIAAFLGAAVATGAETDANRAPPATPVRPDPLAGNGPCGRDCLIAIADLYIHAMPANSLRGVPLAQTVKFSENNRWLKPGEGVFSITKYVEAPRQYVADTHQGEVGVMGVLQDFAGEALFSLRLKVVDRKITEIESVVSHDGEAGIGYMPRGFLDREAMYIAVIPQKVRTSREDLLRIDRLFWDAATTTHDEAKVPFADECFHMENGMNTDWEHNLYGAGFQEGPFRANAHGYHFHCHTDLDTTTVPWSNLHNYHVIADEERGIAMSWHFVDLAPSPPGGNFPKTRDLTEAAAWFVNATRAGGFDENHIPPGLSVRGMATQGAGGTVYHVDLERVIDGKIDRQQDFLHFLPAGESSVWGK